LFALLTVVYIPMIVEARRAARNERDQRARGGVEPPDDVYAAMRVAYPALFFAMIAEAAVRGMPGRQLVAAGLALFAVGKALKWWAIVTLGRFWTFRVIVVPGASLVARGPYRFLRHPNYAGVVLELLGVAVMTGAAVSGPLAIVLFGVLLKRRISVEQRALASSARHSDCSL
jgi:methyltransferase